MSRTFAKTALTALPCAALLAIGTAASAPGEIVLDVSNLRSAKGNILVCLTANPAHFPDCRKDPGAHRLVAPAREAHRIMLNDVAPGDYAVALIHDENGNGKLDTRLMIPVEGFGFSRNPPIRFGPPKFASARFVYEGGAEPMAVKMKYMF